MVVLDNLIDVLIKVGYKQTSNTKFIPVETTLKIMPFLKKLPYSLRSQGDKI